MRAKRARLRGIAERRDGTLYSVTEGEQLICISVHTCPHDAGFAQIGEALRPGDIQPKRYMTSCGIDNPFLDSGLAIQACIADKFECDVHTVQRHPSHGTLAIQIAQTLL